MNELPIHIKKIVKEYTAKKLTSADFEFTASDDGDITKDVYKVALPTFDVLGEQTGTHDYFMTVAALAASKMRVLAELEEYTHKVDAFVADYNALIAVLQDVSNKKKAR